MTSRSGRGRWERVIAARKQAAAALGRDPNAIEPNEALAWPPNRWVRRQLGSA